MGYGSRAVSWFYIRWEIMGAVRAEFDGMRLYCTKDLSSDAKQLFTTTVQALHLIDCTHPRFYRRLRHDLARYLIVPGAGAEYWAAARTCELSTGLLRKRPLSYIASVIVHEAVHARIHSSGVRPRDLAHRERMERICVVAQRRFLEELQRGGHDVQDFVDHLDRVLKDGPLVRRESRRQRALRESLEHGGLPDWWLRLLRGSGPE